MGCRLVRGQPYRNQVELRGSVLPARFAGKPAEHLHRRPFARRCLLEGVDELGFLMAQDDAIAAYEKEGGCAR